MAQAVASGATIQCSFGAAPGSLMVLPTNGVMTSAPTATIMDFEPMTNVLPFGMCSSPANPTVAAATAAAMGVLTPMPCIPVTTPWVPGSPTALVGKMPALNSSSTCNCAWGGVIQIVVPGQFTTMVP